MALLDPILNNLPEVAAPKQKKLAFNEKLKWTLIVLVLYFLLGMIPLWPLAPQTYDLFNNLSLILGASFGTLMSLGIGPIVTGSIILQLLNGAGIINLDTSTHEGKKRYQGVQKITSILFIVFEAVIFVFMGGISAPTNLAAGVRFEFQMLLVLELFLGGMIVLFMDEIVSKWGFGSGISLFIAAGISKQIMIGFFSFKDKAGTYFWQSGFSVFQGQVWAFFQSLFAGQFSAMGLSLFAVISTAVVFVIAVYAQSMKVEIPLSFGRVRGHGIRWPLQFIYTSNMPVILVASLFATMQLWVRLIQNWTGGGPLPILGGYQVVNGLITDTPTGLIAVLQGQDVLRTIVTAWGDWATILPVLRDSFFYILLMVGGSVLFSIFWVQTSNMDAKSVAEQMMSSGLQIPGFRKDRRILERILSRYIMPLTVMGGLTVGFLAAMADLLGALSRGTGILLTVMIIYKMYEDIAREHMYDMNPMMKKFMGK